MSDTPRDFTLDLAAATAAKLEARGRFFGIIEAPGGPLDIQFESGAPLRRGAGGSILLPRFFSRVTLTSTAAQTVRVLVSDEPQDVSNIVAGAGGAGAVIQEQPSAAVSALADNALPAATTENTGANLLRRRITIGVVSTETVGVRVGAAGNPAATGIEIQPGQFVEFRTTVSLGIRNNDAAIATSYYIFEES